MKNGPETISRDPSFLSLSGYERLSSLEKENLQVVEDLGLTDLLIQYHNGDVGYLKDLTQELFNMKLSGYDFPGTLKDHVDYLIRAVSSKIEGNGSYRSQVATVKQCLAEAFGEYSGGIRITDSFFFELDLFMRQVKTLKDYKGEKKGEKYDEVFDGAISGGNAVKGVIIDYGMEARKKMKADLLAEGKTEEDAKKVIKGRSDKFLFLLRERIKYEQ